MDFSSLYTKAIKGGDLLPDEALLLYQSAPIDELIAVANKIRMNLHPENRVSWIIDRNVNITNVCISGCKFCNFHCKQAEEDRSYITSLDEYKTKIDEMFALGGNQLLLQGGMHPKLGLSFYIDLFKSLKSYNPLLKLHALGPPEIVHIARKERKSYAEVLNLLVDAGLDSLPGAGAEILSDRVRKLISPGKCLCEPWLDVMREAHRMNLVTSATMMFGHIETDEERIEHLLKIRDLQTEKPAGSPGFTAFIPWPFMDEGTELRNEGVRNHTTPLDYVRIIAISRIVLHNVKNIQASLLTVGKETAQLCLHAGANDLGSIMIEENVVSAAGSSTRVDAINMQQIIADAGFNPQRRDQAYAWI